MAGSRQKQVEVGDRAAWLESHHARRDRNWLI
jgi:hypothetical protein